MPAEKKGVILSEHHRGGYDRTDVREVGLPSPWWELFCLKGVSYDLLSPGTNGFGALERAFEGLRGKEKVAREIPVACRYETSGGAQRYEEDDHSPRERG